MLGTDILQPRTTMKEELVHISTNMVSGFSWLCGIAFDLWPMGSGFESRSDLFCDFAPLG